MKNQDAALGERRGDGAGAATGGVRQLLRLENLALLLLLVAVYRERHGSWLLFAGLFLVPDLAMLPYLRSTSAGAAAYNAAHSFIAPSGLLLAAAVMQNRLWFAVATIWAAHIAFDRAVGYGLKYATGFGDTHLGHVGRRQPRV